MKISAAVLFSLALVFTSSAALPDFNNLTGKVGITWSGSSWDSPPYPFCHDYVMDAIICMNPQATVGDRSVASGGQGLDGQYKIEGAIRSTGHWGFWATNGYTIFNFIWITDTTSNLVANGLPPILGQPGIMWNGSSSAPSSGILSTTLVTHVVLGIQPGQASDGSPSGHGIAQIVATNVAAANGVFWNDWYFTLLNAWTNDFAGPNLVWVPTNPDHMTAGGQWTQTVPLETRIGIETNVFSAAMNFDGSGLATNRCVVGAITRTGNTLSFPFRADRMWGAWDSSSDGRTNNADIGYTSIVPAYGNTYRELLTVRDAPDGTWLVVIDSSSFYTTGAQLRNGYNLATNHVNPFWYQGLAVLDWLRLRRGLGTNTLMPTHDASGPGPNGNDEVNWYSLVNSLWPASQGDALIAATHNFETNLVALDLMAHNAAQQTNHTVTLTLIPTVIGNEAVTPLPSSATLRLYKGRQPDDGSVQTLNPPIFCWPYDWRYYLLIPENSSSIGTNIQAKVFRLQLSTNADCSAPQLDLVTSNNMENLLPPMTNASGAQWAGTNYWRVIYMNSNQAVMEFTNPIQTYILGAAPVLWDRSMLRDTNYLFQGHPSFFFFTTNRAAYATFLRTYNDGGAFSWSSVSNIVSNTVHSAYWTNDAAATNLDPRAGLDNNISQVALVSQLTTNLPQLTNCGYMIDLACTLYQRNAYTNFEDFNVGDDPKWIAMTYDYCRPYMTTLQRSNVVWTMEALVYDYWFHHDWWYTDLNVSHGLIMTFAGAGKIGNNHAAAGTAGTGLFVCAAMMEDSPKLLEAFPFFLNSLIFEGGDNMQLKSSRGYNEVIAFQTLRNFGGIILMNIRYPEARLTNSPWLDYAKHRLAYDEPLKHTELTEAFGDFGQNQIGWFNYAHLDLALMTGDGAAYRHYVRSASNHPGLTPEFYLQINPPVKYYFATPAEIPWPSNSYVNLREGRAYAGSVPPNDWNAFTNSVTLTFQARPSGAAMAHDGPQDGSYQISAYGAQVIAGGINYYSKNPVLGNGLFVDGIGMQNPLIDPAELYYSYLSAFTNGPAYTLAQANLTKGFNRSNFFPEGGLNTLGDVYYSTNKRPYISDVHRTLFYSTNGYVLEQSHFESTQPAFFQWKFNVQEDTIIVDTNGCSFTFTCTNAYNGSNVAAAVKFITASNTIGLLHQSGTNTAMVNPWTGEDYNAIAQSTDPTSKSNLWAHTIWVTNRVPSTNFNFTVVISPVKWGNAARTLTRLDDNTVEINDGVNDEVVSFGTNYAAASIQINPGATGGTNTFSPFLRNSLINRITAGTLIIGP